jgi:transposase-like protein
MATKVKYFKSSSQERRYRRFSEPFKRARVKELEERRTSVGEICQAYEVSDTAIYKWMAKYSNQSKPERTIVESKSDTSKIIALEKRIAELERLLGQKQVEIEFKDKMLEIAEKKYGHGTKKNSSKNQ